MEYILIFISAIFVNNIVLSQFLGICPFLGVSKKVETAMGMSAAVAFVLTIATIVTFLIQKFVLDVFGLGYLQTITFILDYNQLLYSWCGHPGDSERLRPADRCCVRVFYSHRFRLGTGAFCRIARTDESRESA